MWVTVAAVVGVLLVIGGAIWLAWDLYRKGVKSGYSQARGEHSENEVRVIEQVREAERQPVVVGPERVERARRRVRKQPTPEDDSGSVS